MIEALAKILVAPLIFILSLAGYSTTPNMNVGAALPQAVGVFETSLASPITSSATSMTLAENAIRGGGSLSGYNCFTVDEGSAQAEIICGTVSSTAVSSLSRGISYANGTTTVSANQFSHRRGANVKITDFPIIQILKAQANGEDTYPNLLQYANTVNITGASATTTIATKAYVDSVSIAGASDANTTTKGIVEIATATETASSTALGGTGATLVIPASNATSTYNSATAGLKAVVTQNNGTIDANFIATSSAYTWSGNNTFSGTNTFSNTNTFTSTTTLATTTRTGLSVGGNIANLFTAGEAITLSGSPIPVTFATSSRMFIVDGDVASTTAFSGFAVSSSASGGNVYVQTDGIVNGFTGLTAGSKYYVSDTAGTLATTPGTFEVYVGMAASSTAIIIDRNQSWQYLGSQSLTCTSGGGTVNTVTKLLSRFAMLKIVLADGVNGTNSFATMPIARVGNTQVILQDTTNVGGVLNNYVEVTWNASGTITAAYGGNTNSCTITAYFYR